MMKKIFFLAYIIGSIALISVLQRVRAEEPASPIEFTSPYEFRSSVIQRKEPAFVRIANDSIKDHDLANNSDSVKAIIWSEFMLGAIPSIILTSTGKRVVVFYNPFVDEMVLGGMEKGSAPPLVALIEPYVVNGSAFDHALDVTVSSNGGFLELPKEGLAGRTLKRLNQAVEFLSKREWAEAYNQLESNENHRAAAVKLVSYAIEPQRLSKKEIIAIDLFMKNLKNPSSAPYPSWLVVKADVGGTVWKDKVKLGFGFVGVRGGEDNRDVYIGSKDRAGLTLDIKMSTHQDDMTINSASVIDISEEITAAERRAR